MAESSLGRTLKRRGGNVALRDLAQLAAVDISTVSRALNHDPRVSEARAKQIRKLAERVGYRPRPLRSKHTRSVGVLLASTLAERPDQDYMGRIAWLAQSLLAKRGMHVNVECIDRSSPAKLPAIVKQNRVDGVILGGHPPVEVVDELRSLNVPAVAINDSVARLNISCVRSDPEPAIHEMIIRLAACGHEAFGLLISSTVYPTIQTRFRSYEASLREIGIEPQPAWVVSGLCAERAVVSGREGIRQLVERGALPTAILCENDWMAMGAIHELQHMGLQVPRDVSVVGHDDVWICEQLDPQLTSIHRAEDELVAKAIDLLIEQREDRIAEPKELLVKGEMVWRGSAGPVRDRLGGEADAAAASAPAFANSAPTASASHT